MSYSASAHQTPTNELTASVLQRLNLGGAYCWRQNSGTRGGVRMAPAGTPDVIGLARDGLFIGIEIKAAAADKLNPDQVTVADAIRQRRGYHYECRSFEQFARWCEEVGL